MGQAAILSVLQLVVIYLGLNPIPNWSHDPSTPTSHRITIIYVQLPK